MAGCQFGPDERVILRAHEVKIDGDKALFGQEDELMLTNYNIVFPEKNMFGKVKGYRTWPLADIRLVDGVAQCRLDSSEFMTHKLEISFTHDLVKFVFGSLEAKKEVRSWVNQISQLVTGEAATEENLRATGAGALTDGDDFAETIGNFVGMFEGAAQGAFKRGYAKAAPEVAGRCPSCGASIKGKPGTTVTCPYCEAHVTLEVR